jgi:ribosomal protein S18 acetylase RimI-like enzyme
MSTPPRRIDAPREIDYSNPQGDDVVSLSRDRIPVRSLTAADLPAIIAIDKRITGRTRRAYYERKLAEALEESAVRVSLVAEVEGAVAGFVMARVDFGEFGSPEPEAVIDTIGVDPRFGHRGVGNALLSQLLANLAALRIERVRTEVAWNQFGLLSFLDRLGFKPHRRLALRHAL